MKKTLILSAGFLAAFALGFYSSTLFAPRNPKKQPAKTSGKPAIQTHQQTAGHMQLGAFSVSLSVKDLEASKTFYEKLGFSHFAGDSKSNYLIMKNGNALVGLFQGMFQGNILTFNPGWDENAQNTESFDDVREIQRMLKSNGITLDNEVDENATGPAGFMLKDPDGNVILIDQHR